MTQINTGVFYLCVCVFNLSAMVVLFSLVMCACSCAWFVSLFFCFVLYSLPVSLVVTMVFFLCLCLFQCIQWCSVSFACDCRDQKQLSCPPMSSSVLTFVMHRPRLPCLSLCNDFFCICCESNDQFTYLGLHARMFSGTWEPGFGECQEAPPKPGGRFKHVYFQSLYLWFEEYLKATKV